MLRLDDVGAGWQAKPHAPTTDYSIADNLAACSHVPVTLINTDLQPHADSDDFHRDPADELLSGVAMFPAPAQARAAVAVQRRPETNRCTASAFRTAFAGTNSTVTVETLSVPAIGERSAALRVIRRVGANTVYADLLFAHRGRAFAFVGSVSPTAPDPTFEAGLLRKIDTRLR